MNYKQFNSDVVSKVIEEVGDYSTIHDRIIFKVISYERNRQQLKDVPHICYLDLAIVFYCNMQEFDTDEGKACMVVKNEHLQGWNITVDELMKDAMENTPKILGLKIQGILSTICEYLGETHLKEMIEKEERDTPMYVATNNQCYNGAAVLLYKDFLRAMAAKLKSDIFVIPVSIHEIIIVEAIEGVEVDTTVLKDMIYKVNREEIKPEEVLSDNLYLYSRSAGKLVIV